MLPKTTGSPQTQKSMSFTWIVWSTLYVYLWIYHQLRFPEYLLFAFIYHNLTNLLISLYVPMTFWIGIINDFATCWSGYTDSTTKDDLFQSFESYLSVIPLDMPTTFWKAYQIFDDFGNFQRFHHQLRRWMILRFLDVLDWLII